MQRGCGGVGGGGGLRKVEARSPKSWGLRGLAQLQGLPSAEMEIQERSVVLGPGQPGGLWWPAGGVASPPDQRASPTSCFLRGDDSAKRMILSQRFKFRG